MLLSAPGPSGSLCVAPTVACNDNLLNGLVSCRGKCASGDLCGAISFSVPAALLLVIPAPQLILSLSNDNCRVKLLQTDQHYNIVVSDRFDLVWFNGTFSKNRLYHAIGV